MNGATTEKLPLACDPLPRDPLAINWVNLWGVPFAPFTFQETLDFVEKLIARGEPGYFVTANLHTVMLADGDSKMKEAIDKAVFTLADGMPMVWATRWRKHSIPERVAGADLFPALCELAAHKGYRVYLLGGAPGIGEQAAANLCARYPGLQIVGIESPSLHQLTPEEESDLLARIKATKPHLFFVALGQPKGELWLRKHCQALGVPVCAQIGGTLDFFAGKVPRAPRWLQRIGLEWAFRLYQEPKRLFLRYANNTFFLLRMLFWGPRSQAGPGMKI